MGSSRERPAATEMFVGVVEGRGPFSTAHGFLEHASRNALTLRQGHLGKTEIFCKFNPV